jgi:hypothetical protein
MVTWTTIKTAFLGLATSSGIHGRRIPQQTLQQRGGVSVWQEINSARDSVPTDDYCVSEGPGMPFDCPPGKEYVDGIV